jgi:hypothetical protein
MTTSRDREPVDMDREYVARVPFMAVGAVLGGGAGGLVGVQFVVGLGFGLIAFAIFGVAVVVFAALVGGTLGAIGGLTVYAIAAKVGAIGRRSPPVDARPDRRARGRFAPDMPPGEGASPVVNAQSQAQLAAELAAFAVDLAQRQARGEMPPPNPESEVPYARVAADWRANRMSDVDETEHSLDTGASPDEDHLWFGPNQAQVVAFLSSLSRATPAMWNALARVQLEFATPGAKPLLRQRSVAITRAGAAGTSSGAITVEDVTRAKEMAEAAATKALGGVVDLLMERTATEPRERIEAMWSDLIRSGANAIATLLLVRPFMTSDEWEAAWRPYAELLPQFAAR